VTTTLTVQTIATTVVIRYCIAAARDGAQFNLEH
jgi:hypothetical protein